MPRNTIFYLVPMSLIFVLASIPHFTNTAFYLPLMPPFLPFPYELVVFTGIAELVFAVGIWWKKARPFLIWAMILMLLLFLILHIYHVFLIAIGEKVPSLEHVPHWVFWLRIPLQFVIIQWVYSLKKLE